jgi:tRNA A-37 threonylcarbamoyl transferase component Bud32
MTEPTTPIFTKLASAPVARERLRAEAEMLRRAAHPGVVPLASYRDLEDRTELATARIDGQNLAFSPPADAATAVSYAAAIASTVADLHQLGIVHRRLTADHVLVDPSGRPILCGFAEATTGDPETDLRALGALFELLAGSVPATSNRDARVVRRLLALAERARGESPPPTAAALAEAAGRLASRTFGLAPGRGRPLRDRFGTRRRKANAIVTIAGLAVLALGGRVRITAGPSALAPAATTTTREAARSATTTAALPTTSTGGPKHVEAGGARFEIGREGDVVVFGDWDCDGEPGAALLRPATGAIYMFDVLATPGSNIEGRPIAQIEGAQTLLAIDQPNGCTSLTVRLADGSPRVLLGGAR